MSRNTTAGLWICGETVQIGESIHYGDVHELRAGVATATASRRQRSFPRSEPLTPSMAWQRNFNTTLYLQNIQSERSLLQSLHCSSCVSSGTVGLGYLLLLAAVSPVVSPRYCVSSCLSAAVTFMFMPPLLHTLTTTTLEVLDKLHVEVNAHGLSQPTDGDRGCA